MEKVKKVNNLDYYALIGEFTVKFNFLENVMTDFMWTLAELNNKSEDQMIARIIFKDVLFSSKLKILRNLFEYHFGKDEKFNDIHKKLININAKRNKFIHSLWFINYGSEKDIKLNTVIWDNKKLVRNLVNGRKKLATQKVKPNEIKETIKEIEELYNEINFFQYEMISNNQRKSNNKEKNNV